MKMLKQRILEMELYFALFDRAKVVASLNSWLETTQVLDWKNKPTHQKTI